MNTTFATNEKGNLVLEFISNINIDNGYTVKSVGQHKSTMELIKNNDGIPVAIEWDNPIDTVEIGLWFNNKTLQDYDGVFELPIEAVSLIRKAGYIVPKDFLN